MIIKLIGFQGELPSLIPRVLPDNAAQQAYNVRLNDGGLTPFRLPKEVASLVAPPDGFKTIYLHDDVWYGWPTQVWVTPGPVAADRLYITGDGVPKLIVGGVTYPLALPSPSAALTAAVSGTSTSTLGSTRFYVRTFVTSLGEESQPSPASNSVYWEPGQTVTLSGFTLPPTGRAIVSERIYRAQTGFTGTKLYFIAERPVSTANFVDNIASTASNEPLPSLDWDPPVDSLAGLIALPNGMMAAFSGKTLYFCELWYPHAWPEMYSLTTDYDIVGLGAFGTSIAVLTKGNPYVVTGTHPSSMYMEKMELNLPCVSARGIADLGYAVAYPSNDGLVLVSNSGAQIATKGIMTRQAWDRINPYSIHAGQKDGRYFACYQRDGGDGALIREAVIIDTTGEQPFIIRSDIIPDAMFFDMPSGKLYFSNGSLIYEFDAFGRPNAILSWKSKEFIVPKPVNFGAIMVEAETDLSPEDEQAIQDQIARDIAANEIKLAAGSPGDLNGDALNCFDLNGDDLVEVYRANGPFNYAASIIVVADDKTVATVDRVNTMVRLPGGFQARKWEFAVNGDMRIVQITVAQTGMELAGA